MGNVKRVYVEKKPEYAVQAKDLYHELHGYLGIKDLKNVRVLIRYDVENITDETFEKACNGIFSEPPVDTLYKEEFPMAEGSRVFSVEFLPGQFDQRADSAVQCVQFIKEDEQPVIHTATTYVVEGNLTDEEFEAVKKHCINPVDSRETGMEKPDTLVTKFEEPEDVRIFDGFKDMEEAPFKELYDSLGLAMTFKDFLHIQNYFRNEEHRDPSMTEIRVLDTYWSDHCRHTTFSTELTDVSFGEGDYKEPIQETYRQYLKDHSEIFKGREDKFVCLMDLALMAMRKLKREGKLEDQEESEEINACSIVVPVTVDGVEEEWLVNFKNETHNHPTEIEPFGGAATCLGGAIRDPLSGRTYVYQAMRVTGAADPTVSAKDTLKGKLPQKKLVREAAHGYSSYGNQIGLATGAVKEIYHPNYVAKRMEIGAVLGAAPRRAVIRETSDPGDIIRIGSNGNNQWATGFEPAIEQVTVREYAEQYLEEVNDAYTGDYSENSAAALAEAKAALQILLDNPAAEDSALESAVLALEEAVAGLEAPADYTAVDAVMAEAGALTEGQYTEDSWAALQAAVEAVQRGLGVSDQEIVNGYAEAIQNAIDGLVRVYIVTVNGEEFMRGVYNTPVTVTAPEAPEGQKFAGWSVNGNIISLDETYLFYLGGDVELTATYVDAEQDVEQSPSAIMSNIIITDAGSGRYNVKLVGQVVVPDGYTLQQAGVLIGRNTELAQLHSDNGGVADGVTKAMSSVVNTKGQFSMNVKNMPAGNSMQCEIYLSVQNNATGETEWFYSPVQLVEV